MSIGWNNIRLGAGGYVTQAEISPDGLTFVIGTDSTGAYIQNRSDLSWKQIIRSPGFPGVDENHLINGAYCVTVAPGDSTRLYLGFIPQAKSGVNSGFIYKSSDRGVTFTQTAYTLAASSDCNALSKKCFGPKIAADPANKDIVYLSDGDGTFKVTTDAFTTSASVPSVPTVTKTGADGAVCGGSIVFDPASSVVSGVTQGIYIYSPGNGVYHSTNGGTSFSLISGGPASYTPTTFYASHMKIASDGVLYLTQKAAVQSDSRLWRWQSSTWTNLQPNIASGSIDIETVFVNASSSAFVGIGGDGGYVYTSTDHGATWTDPGGKTRTAGSITWFGIANENYMTVGEYVLDPSVSGRLWFAEGIGMWYSTAPAYNGYLESSVGIENMIWHLVISPPGGYQIICSSDRPVFTVTNPDVYPTTYGPNLDTAVAYGSSLDWASSDPSYVVCYDTWVDNSNSYSTDKGVTWTRFAGITGEFANGKLNGAIAAATPLNSVVVPWNRGDVWNTKDGGATWTKIDSSKFTTNGVTASGVRNSYKLTISAVASGTGGNARFTTPSTAKMLVGDTITGGNPFGGDLLPVYNSTMTVSAIVDGTHFECSTAFTVTSSGSILSTFDTFFPWAYFLNAQIVCADRTTFGTFYVHNWGSAANGGGIYKSTDGGDNWVRQSTAFALGGHNATNNARLRSVPNLAGNGTAGHLFMTAGDNDSVALYYSTDGGQNWTAVGSGTSAVGVNVTVGFGAPASGNDYPSIFVVGVINSVWGVYRSDNSKAQWAANTITWTSLGQFPLGSVSSVSSIEGDPSVWGRCYLTTQQDGCYYYSLTGGVSVLGFSVIQGHARRHVKMMGY